MQLKPAEPDEIDAFVELLEAAARWQRARGIDQWQPGSMAAQRASFARLQAAGELFVGVEAGRMIGGCVLRTQIDPVWSDRPERAAAYLSKLVAARHGSGAALGEQILEAAQTLARERGAEWLRLDCVASNVSLARYYQRLGFYPRGVVDGLLRHDKRLLPEAGAVVASLDAVDFGRWQPDRVATLMFVVHDGRILLIRKLRGHGAGKINAPGGMVEAGETPLQCALREIEEEVHVRAHAPTPLAQLCFQDTDGSSMLGYAFLTHDYSGEPRATAEAVPFWCSLEHIPYGQMWDDDVVWLPRLLDRLPSVGEFLMRDGRLVAHRLRSATQSELAQCTNRPVG